VIGAVGRLEKQKRFDVLMEAVARLRARAPHLRLLIAGAGGLDQELRDLHARLGLGQACTLLGHRTDIIDLHHAFDIFVQASDREGSPNVVLEAMALETPIITTNAGGTGDLITDHADGLIIPHGDVDAMQRAILEVLDNPAAAQARAEHARGRVENEFSFDRRMDRVEAIYEELVQR
jgi:glycosyltransferase involved in cell wall biosynthesis